MTEPVGAPAGVAARLPRSFYRRDPTRLAPDLLNKLVVVADGRVGRIVEVEAYRADDPASHTFRGLTPRNAVMFGPPGHLYVYFSYGVHWCANVVCGDEGEGAAVLLRALEPVAGIEAMFAARPKARRAEDLCSGPGKLTQALGLDRSHNGADLVEGDEVWLGDDGRPPPDIPVRSPRVGISVARERLWRWSVPGNRHVSRPTGRAADRPARPGDPPGRSGGRSGRPGDRPGR